MNRTSYFVESQFASELVGDSFERALDYRDRYRPGAKIIRQVTSTSLEEVKE